MATKNKTVTCTITHHGSASPIKLVKNKNSYSVRDKHTVMFNGTREEAIKFFMNSVSLFLQLATPSI